MKNGSKFTMEPINVTKGQNFTYRLIFMNARVCRSFKVEANYNGKIIDTRTLSMGIVGLTLCLDGTDKSVNLIIP